MNPIIPLWELQSSSAERGEPSRRTAITAENHNSDLDSKGSIWKSAWGLSKDTQRTLRPWEIKLFGLTRCESQVPCLRTPGTSYPQANTLLWNMVAALSCCHNVLFCFLSEITWKLVEEQGMMNAGMYRHPGWKPFQVYCWPQTEEAIHLSDTHTHQLQPLSPTGFLQWLSH